MILLDTNVLSELMRADAGGHADAGGLPSNLQVAEHPAKAVF